LKNKQKRHAELVSAPPSEGSEIEKSAICQSQTKQARISCGFPKQVRDDVCLVSLVIL